MARNVAGQAGYRIEATTEELDGLRLDICLERLPFEVVRDYFAGRMKRGEG